MKKQTKKNIHLALKIFTAALIIILGAIAISWAWPYWNLWTGLNIECHDIFCQMRRIG